MDVEEEGQLVKVKTSQKFTNPQRKENFSGVA